MIKISSKYRIRWFGLVTEVKPGTAQSEISVGPVRDNPLVRFGSVTLFTPNRKRTRPTCNSGWIYDAIIRPFQHCFSHIKTMGG